MKGNAFVAILGIILVLALFIYWGARYQKGNIELLRGNLKEAEKNFKELLERDPEDRNARRRLAEVLFRQERYGEAAGELERIFEKHAPLPEEYLMHALSVIGTGQRAEGFALLRTFPHLRYRVAQAVREEAASLSRGDDSPPELEKRLMDAWKRGKALEEQERKN